MCSAYFGSNGYHSNPTYLPFIVMVHTIKSPWISQKVTEKNPKRHVHACSHRRSRNGHSSGRCLNPKRLNLNKTTRNQQVHPRSLTIKLIGKLLMTWWWNDLNCINLQSLASDWLDLHPRSLTASLPLKAMMVGSWKTSKGFLLGFGNFFRGDV